MYNKVIMCQFPKMWSTHRSVLEIEYIGDSNQEFKIDSISKLNHNFQVFWS